ncbi:MAG: choice-of-anchor Q domain-containing protein, partial [Daejeonella sp.]
GGDIYNSGASSPKIINSTFSTNTAQTAGSAIANEDGVSLSVTNSILYGDTGGEISNTGSATATISYSLVQGGALSMTHVIDEDPQFENTAAGNFNLKAGSPAINAGSNLAAGGIPTDLAGKQRIQDTNIDLGAYESGTVAPPAAVKGILYVTEEGAGDMSGKNWKNAVNGVAAALEKAKSNLDITEVWAAKGIYYPTDNPVTGGVDNRDKTFLLRNSLILYGGFAGVENKVSQRNIGNNPTILSGNFGNDANPNNNAYHVVISSGNSSTTILDGFIVEEGNANDVSNAIVTAGGANVTIPRNSAGGIFNRTSSPILRNIIFRMNKSTSSGGAMVNSISSSPTMINTVFYKNSTGAQGGAIYNTAGSSPAINNSTFNSNTAITGGGAIFNTISNSITNSILYGNSSGGASSNITGPAAITYSLNNVDPLFENAAIGDLRLQPISPAINKGNSLSVPADITTDVVGNQRIYGTAVDIGAYESASYQAETANTPITNILSPNGDGINDFLVIQDADQYKNQLVIWNRAGQVIYTQTDYKNDWAGTINGTPVIEDAYFFAIVFSGPNIDKKFTGSVTVLRN